MLRMEENTQHFRLCFIISGKVKTQLKHKKRICAVYGEGAVTDQMCQKWSAKFCAGDFLLGDALWWGRPVEVDSGHTKYSLRTINVLRISKSIKLLVKMKTVSLIYRKKLNGLFGQPNSKERRSERCP